MRPSPSFLVADDDELLGRSLARALRPFGHAELAHSVDAARRVTDARSFDGLLVDVALGDGSGFDVAGHVRERDGAVPIVIISARVDPERLSAAHRLRATYLTKPLCDADISAFAAEARAHSLLRASKIEAAVRRWRQEYRLTPAEAKVVLLGARGVQRFALAAHRGVAESTIKTQVERLLAKTGDDTFEAAANRLLREVIGET